MSIEAGMVTEGKVVGLKPFGAFVELEPGVSGMVHISEVANSYVENITDVLQMGQTVRVRVLSVSPEGKIALSIRKALPQEAAPGRISGRPQGARPPRKETPRVWQPPRPAPAPETLSFEDMMNRYKQRSEEKLGDLNRSTEVRRARRSKK